MGVGAILLTSCGSVQLTDAGSRVRVMKADPPAECQELGAALGSATGLAGPALIEEAKIDARNKAGEMGANYLRWDTVDERGSVTGTAYKCPEGRATNAPGSAATQ